MSVVLDVTVRDNTGTGGARAARRNNLVPGVIYGGDKDPVAVAVKYNEVLKAINSGQFIGSMIELTHEGSPQKVFTKDIQFHPVTDAPMHLDFYRVTAKTLIEVEVNVNFLGEEESPGLKEGGTLNVVIQPEPPSLMIGQIVRFEASVSGPNRWQLRSDISASKASASSAIRATVAGPSSIHTTAEQGIPS